MYLNGFPQNGQMGLSAAGGPLDGMKLGGEGGEDDTVGCCPIEGGPEKEPEGGPELADN